MQARWRPTGLTYRSPSYPHPGYTLFSNADGDHATLIDADGKIVHRWTHPDGIQNAQLLSNGNLLFYTSPIATVTNTASAKSIIELDWNGNVVWELRRDDMRHDFVRCDNGNTLLLLWDELTEEVRERVRGGLAGSERGHMAGDRVVEVSPAGEIVRDWRASEHCSFDEDVICPLERRHVWTHANSINVTPDGKWLLSFRTTDTLALVDPATGAFTWKWGAKILSHQHHATMLDNGHVLVFDNGGHRRGEGTYSRIVEVNPASNEIVWTYRGPVLMEFYTYMFGSATRLPNGNTFVSEGAKARLFEVNPAGELVWEYVSGLAFNSRFGPSRAIFRAYRYALDDARFVGRDLDPGRWARLTEEFATEPR